MISDYMIEMQEVGMSRWEKVPAIVAGTSYTVTGLDEGRQYTFR